MQIRVQIIDVDEFVRENWHIMHGWDEDFVAVTMRDAAGRIYKNFTRADRPFASYATAVVGQDAWCELDCRFKEERNTEENGRYTCVTYVRPYVKSDAEIRKEKKRLARMKKLGLA